MEFIFHFGRMVSQIYVYCWSRERGMLRSFLSFCVCVVEDAEMLVLCG